MSDDATLVLTDIKAALASANKEAEDKPAALLVVGGELNGTLFDLTEQELTVGRSAKCEIPLEFNGISREHFKLNATEEGYNVEDLGSRNGTFLILPIVVFSILILYFSMNVKVIKKKSG